MKKIIFLLLIMLIYPVMSIGQTYPLSSKNPTLKDTLLQIIQSNIHDTTRVVKYVELATITPNRNTARTYLLKAYDLSRKLKYSYGEYMSLFELAFNYNVSGEWARGMEYSLLAIEKSKKENNKDFLSPFYNMMALSYEKQKDWASALKYSKMGIAALTYKVSKQPTKRWAAYMSTSGYMFHLNYPLDSVNHYTQKSIEFGKEDGLPEHLYGYSYLRYAWSFSRQNKIDSAQFYYHKTLNIFEKYKVSFTVQEVKRDIAQFHFDKNQLDSARFYATSAYNEALKIDNVNVVIDAAHLLYKMNEKSNPNAAFAYLQKYNELKDSIFNKEKYNQIYQIQANENQKIADAKSREVELRTAKQQNLMMLGGVIFALAALGLGLIARQRKRSKDKIEKAYDELSQVKTEIESKNRDLEIEATLDKIRSASLAMQHSDQLENVVTVLFEKLKDLGLVFDGGAAIHVFSESSKDMAIWVVSPQQPPTKISLPYDAIDFVGNTIILDVWEAKETGISIINKIYSFEEKNKYFQYVFKHNDYTKIPEMGRNFILNAPNYTATFIAERNSLLGANSWTGQIFSGPDFEILKRVAKVFEQAYVRFLDLQKAEAQTREAQINLAVERVRARALAMFKSEEILEVVFKLKQEMMELDIPALIAATIHLKVKDDNYTMWDLTELGYTDGKIHQPMVVDYRLDEMDPALFIKKIWENKEPYCLIVQDNEGIKRTLNFLRDHGRTKEADESKEYIKNNDIKYVYHPAIPLNNGRMCLDLLESPPDEIEMILTKMGAAFDLAYKRFEDLKNSEIQLREADIELALERVRSSAMAMQQSNQLREIAGTTLEQLQGLGFTFGACSIVIMDAITGDMDWWISGFDNEYPRSFRNTYFEHPFYLEQLNNWKAGKKYAVMVCEGEAKKAYDEYVFSKTDFVKIPDELQKIMQSFEKITFSNAYMQHGALSWSTDPLTEEHAIILQRFAAVFEQSYTRFLDLQKAEAQTREAQIEVALEKVRSRSLAMHHSDELAEAATVLFQQVTNLGVNAFASVFHIWQPDGISTMCWANGGDGMQPPLRIPHLEEPFHKSIYDAWKRGEEFYILESEGEALANTYRFIYEQIGGKSVLDNIEDSGFPIPDKQVTHIAFFTQGYVMFNTYENTHVPYEVFKRFAKVFEQTYTRFLDLQKAEEQARESQIEASLERIRSRAMAMDSSEELNSLIGFIYKECTKLNMHLDRGFIMTFDNDSKDAHWWMVSADAPDMPLKILVKYHEYAPYMAILNGWENREQRWSYMLEGDNKKSWDDYQFANALSQLPDSVKNNMQSVKSVILNASFQKFGCIMLSSFEPLNDDHFDLLIRLSKVFDLTYVRFLDLQLKEQNTLKLAEEKQKLEQTLTELKATQSQLIQKEKLASLGELTAGIAHEIQNPLNFVNNFSEVSIEIANDLRKVLDQVKSQSLATPQYLATPQSIASPEVSEAQELIDDLITNQEKINQHGQRASSIVKGMLEHSRKSTGEKSPTDINALCDEYLRLSYHGLRAKDKSFNADFELIADPLLPKVNVIPQDIGRVLLNLINNAFWAVTAKLKVKNEKLESDYKPKVSVFTRIEKSPSGDLGVISVKDNGNGIPKENIDKIFQPFFTTKPTGQGTGLGLSLSYDIVKVHNGELKVESNVGEGTEFKIIIPINK